MFPPRQDVLRLMPEIILSLSGILLMLIEPFLSGARRTLIVTLAVLGSGLALVSTIYPGTLPGAAFSGLLRIDGFSVFEVGRAHVGTPVTWPSRMPSSARSEK